MSLNSVEADSRLLCRSSKLTEGRKSKDAVVGSSLRSPSPPCRPKEKSEWLFEDEALSIGALLAIEVVLVLVGGGLLVGLMFSLALYHAIRVSQPLRFHIRHGHARQFRFKESGETYGLVGDREALAGLGPAGTL